MANGKRGRPALSEPKTARQIKKSFTLTPAENCLLEETAAMYEMSQCAVMVKAVMELHQKGKQYKPKQQDEGAETAGGELNLE